MHIQTAVYRDGLAGHEVAVVGGEKDHRADQIGGKLVAVKGAALAPVGELLGGHHAFLVGLEMVRPGMIEFTQMLSSPTSRAHGNHLHYGKAFTLETGSTVTFTSMIFE